MSSTSKVEKQIPGAGHVAEGEGTDLAIEQRFHQERGRAGLEPPGIEFATVEEQEDVEGVVHLLLAPPTVAVVPVADLVSVEPGSSGANTVSRSASV